MDCRQCQDLLDDLLIAEPGQPERAELVEHLDRCADCARQHVVALEALAAIRPAAELRASPNFKERVMQAISEACVSPSRPTASGLPSPSGRGAGGEGSTRLPAGFSRRGRLIKLVAGLAVAAALVVALVPLFRGPSRDVGPTRPSAFGLFNEACAAEGNLFAGNQIVHLLSEIVVVPIDDPTLAKTRWVPMFSLDANGKPRFDQLSLPAEAGKGYTVVDQSWYDPATTRFVRVLTADGKPIFANACDGTSLYRLEIPARGSSKVVKQPLGKEFHPPQSPADFLGMAAGLHSTLEAKDENLVHDEGTVKLNDGADARVLKLTSPEGGPKQATESYYLVTIRLDTKIVERTEWVVQGKPILIVRRGKAAPGQVPPMGWDLTGIAAQAAAGGGKSGPAILANMVIPNVSVEHMATKAGFPTYIFDKAPAWAGQREITDVLDVASPPHRMFSVTYRAKDGRHVVFVQSFTYNKALGPFAKINKVIYTSPTGIKVLSGPQDTWLAQILLRSTGAWIGDPPGKDVTGYLLETPAGTYPALAINGKLSEEELHGLIDSLVPAEK